MLCSSYPYKNLILVYSWKEDSIFVKPSSTRSEDNYYVLNEKLLPKSKCEKIYSANINEMSIEYEHSRYNAMLKEIINSGKDITSIYKYIIAEYKAGRLTKNDSFGLLRANHVPLKNALGQITMNKLFTCEQEKQGYFTTKLLMEITVHEECRSLAMDLCYQPLNEIHYDDLRYYEELTQDEVEELLDDPDHYFINYEELLRNFYRAGLLSDALLQEYNLEYLSYGGYDTASYSFEFPSEQAGNRVFLAKHIRKLWKAPGEMIVIDKNGVNSITTHCGKKGTICVFEYVYFARPDSVIEGSSVHMARLRAGKYLWREHPVDADIVIGVPDSGLDAALGFSQESGIPYGIGFIKNRYIGRTFIQPSQTERTNSVKIKLNAISSTVKGKRVVMIDDSIVRGTTSGRIVKLLRDAGAKEVHVRISSPAFIAPCYFGTDIDSKENLIACKMTNEEICEYIGADSLGYLSVESVKKLAGNSKCDFCVGCFTEKYPIEVPKDMPKDKFESKISEKK